MNWMIETTERIRVLKQEGFYKNWEQKSLSPITFIIHPAANPSRAWLNARLKIYLKNVVRLKTTPPPVTFYIYPSLEEGRKNGLTPAISLLKEKEIHGHLKQSPGHELTHILLGELNPSENLPPNGLWSEGVCVYLDGTGADRKRHSLSLGLNQETLNTPWVSWRKNLPGNLYPLAGSILQYCDHIFGWEKILTFLEQMRDQGSNDETLIQKIFSTSHENLRRAWLDWLRKN